MASLILEIVVQGLKLLYLIIDGILKYNAEEMARFQSRMQIVSDALKAAIDNKDESLNEEAYLSNLAWEQKQRYQTYKTQTLTILTAGGGIVELSAVVLMAMGLRVTKYKDKIIAILVKDLVIEEKSKEIAAFLTTNS